MNDYRINGKRALKDIQAWFRLHLMPFFGGRRMASTTTADVRAYIAKRQADTVSVRTAHEVVRRTGLSGAFPSNADRLQGSRTARSTGS